MTTWTESALCAQVDGELFFPEKGGSTREAKSVCRSCPVRAECLEYVLGHDDRFGIFGGFSERERRQVARDHAAGVSLEDIIAADDAAYYARQERKAA